MTNPRAEKGARAERELAGLLEQHLGVKVRRKLGAGRQDDTGDLDMPDMPWVCVQVKNYRDVARALREGLAGVQHQKVNAGAEVGVVAVRRPGGRWVIAMDVEDFAWLIREAM